MLRYVIVAAVFAACAGPPGNPQGVYEDWSQGGVALRVPAGSTVTAEPEAITVDAPGGSRWFEVRWVPLPAGSLADAGRQWLQRNCLTLIEDDPWAEHDTLWATGGRCRYREWAYRTMVLVERRGDRGLLTAYLAHEDQMNFENGWVDFHATAMSLTAGTTPTAAPVPDDVRRELRAAITALPPTTKPQLEGGRLTRAAFGSGSARIAERHSRPVPERFGESPPNR